MCRGVQVGVRGKLAEAGSLSHGFPDQTPDSKAWQQAPFPTESSCLSSTIILKNSKLIQCGCRKRYKTTMLVWKSIRIPLWRTSSRNIYIYIYFKYMCPYIYRYWSLSFYLKNGYHITYTLYSTLHGVCIGCGACVGVCGVIDGYVCMMLCVRGIVFVELCECRAAGIRTWHLILGTHAAALKYTARAVITLLACISVSVIKLQEGRKITTRLFLKCCYAASLRSVWILQPCSTSAVSVC